MIAASLLLCGIPAQAAERFLLAVGNNVGDANEVALRWAEEDARKVLGLFRQLGGIAPGRSTLLLAGRADQVAQQLEHLRQQVARSRERGQRTELFLFFSGHGDDRALHLGSSRLTLADLRQALRRVAADTTLTIIDACRRDRLGRGRQKGATRGPSFEVDLRRDAGPRGQVTIRSAGADEIAQESDDLRGSFFTHYMLSGLRGAADRDGDARVTLAELYRHVYHRTLAASHRARAAVQHPEISVELAGEGELVLTEIARASARLVLAAGLSGDLLVVDDHSGQVVAEVRKSAGRASVLALRSGRFRIQLRLAGRIRAGEVALEWGGTREVTADLLAEQPLAAALAKGAALDPEAWLVGAQMLAGSALAADEPMLWGARITTLRRLGSWPLFVGAAVYGGIISTTSVGWDYEQQELGGRVGAGLEHHLGPLRGQLSAGVGLVFVHENAERREAARLRPIPGTRISEDGWTIGPAVYSEVTVALPLVGGLSAVAGTTLTTAWLVVDREKRTRLSWQVFWGLDLAL